MRSGRSGAEAARARRSCSHLAIAARSSWPTGAYGYPVELAAPVAIGATEETLAAQPSVEVARFVFRDEGSLASYRSAIGA